MFSSIKMKITSAVFALVMLSMCAAGILVNLRNEKTLKKTIFNEQAVLLNAAAKQIDDHIFQALVDLDETADLITAEMVATPAKAQLFLDARKQQQVFYDDTLCLFDRSGRLIAASPAENNFIGRNFSFRNYFRQTVATGKILISPPMASIQKKSQIIMMFTSPVCDRSGRIIGVVGGVLNINKQRYLHSLRALKLGRGGYLSLYDSNGTAIMHPHARATEYVALPGSMVQRAAAGYEGTEETVAEDGVPVIRSVKKLTSSDWILAASYPLKDAYQPLYAARQNLLVCGVVAALLSALSVWHLIRVLFAPLLSFTSHLERVTQEEGTPARVPVQSRDEVGVMAQAFNRMIAETRRRAEELREVKDFAENLVLGSSLPTFVLDRWQKVLYWNKACEKLTGIPAAEMVGTTRHRTAIYGKETPCLADLIIDGNLSAIRLHHPPCLASELAADGWHCEGWFKLNNGDRRYLVVDSAPIYDPEGKVTAAIETIQDHTWMEESADKIAQLSRVLEQAPYTVVLAALDGTIEYANAAIAGRGYRAADVIGLDLRKIMPADEKSGSGRAVREAIAQAAGWQGEIVTTGEDGAQAWDHLSLSRITNRSGEATHLVAIFKDITLRKQTEQALQMSEALHRQIFVENPQPMWVYDKSTLAFLAVNNAAVRHYGYSSEEFLAMTIRDIRPKEEVPRLAATLSSLNRGAREHGIWQHVKKDGTVIYVAITSHAMQFMERDARIILVHDLTAEKRAEYELRLSEERYRNIFDGVADVIYSVKPDGTFLSINRAFEAMSGWPVAEWTGRKFTDLVHEEDLALVGAAMRSCIEGNELRKLEYRARDRWQNIVYLEVDATPHLENGEVAYIRGIARDITERKLGQQKQEYLQRRLSAMWNIAKMVDERVEALEEMALREITSMTQSKRGFFGSVDQARREMALHCWSAEVPSRCGKPRTVPLSGGGALAEVVKTGNTLILNDCGSAGDDSFERMHECGFGIIRIIAVPIVVDGDVVAVYAVANKEGEYTELDAEQMKSFLKNVQIILEKRRAEESLVKLSHAINQSPVSVVITDAAGKIEFVNPRFTETTGYGLAEVQGKSPGILSAERMPKAETEHLWETLAAGKVWNGIFLNRKKNGETFWGRATITSIRNKDSEITNYIGMNEDITERLQLEQQLRQSQKMEALGTLSGGIAHDFNNILTSITAYCALLEKMTPPEESRKRHYLEKVMESASRAGALTRSLLAYSRNHPLDKKVIDINDVLGDLHRLLSPVIGEDVEFRVLKNRAPMTVLADRHQVEQVLMNLCMNGRDAMPEGGVLKVEVERVSSGNPADRVPSYLPSASYVRLAVSDTGTGIDPRTRERIFEPFFTTKEVDKGTGLGLSIVYGIVNQHQGYVDVWSESGQGAVFSIYLPIADACALHSKPSAGAAEQRGYGTILLVEDEAEIRAPLKELLEEKGYRVIEARDGEEATAKYRMHKSEVKLVILDVVMPKKNGRQAYEEMRQITHDVKVLFISGYTSDILSSKGFSGDEINFISKPIKIDPLLLKIGEVMQHGR